MKTRQQPAFRETELRGMCVLKRGRGSDSVRFRTLKNELRYPRAVNRRKLVFMEGKCHSKQGEADFAYMCNTLSLEERVILGMVVGDPLPGLQG